MFPKIICGYTLDFGYDGECINLIANCRQLVVNNIYQYADNFLILKLCITFFVFLLSSGKFLACVLENNSIFELFYCY